MSTFRRIYGLLTAHQRKQAVVLLMLTIVGMVLEMLGLGLVLPVIGLLTQADPASAYPQLRPLFQRLGNPSQAQLVTAGMLGLVALHVIRVAFLGFLSWRQMSFAAHQQATLSDRLFATYLRQPYTFHLNRNSAELIQNAIGEVRMFTFNVMLPAMVLLTEGSIMLGMAVLLIVMEPMGALSVVTVLAVAAWVFLRALRRLVDRQAKARQLHEGLRLQHLQQGLSGVKDVKVLGREREFLARYAFHNQQTAQIARVQLTLQQLPRLWLELLAVCGLAGLVLTMKAQGQDVGAIVPTLGLFAAGAFRMMPSVNRFMGAFQSLRFGAPVVDRLHREIALGVPDPLPPRQGPQAFQTAISLAGITYTYPFAASPALSDVSIVIAKGASVGFIGPSGSGKSTLVDLILGLLAPDAGQVTVDGRDIRLDLRAWQDHIGYVPQTIYLTDDTLRHNVAFGLPAGEIDDRAVQRAIAAAQLDALVASLPDGMETMVGERGIRLSGGQRQRIGIARALYHDPAVLVLDEATSALDADTERDVMKAVTALHGTKTLLIVAHRLSTVEHCDRLYRLDQGRVTETHQAYAE
jgi:ABC-type multidrug transport system fused ATPase/permease subunit